VAAKRARKNHEKKKQAERNEQDRTRHVLRVWRNFFDRFASSNSGLVAHHPSK